MNLDHDQIDLDITAFACPMTFVRVRLLLDRLAPGAVATIRLSGDEPRANIPRQLQRLGHAVLDFAPEAVDSEAWRLRFRAKA
jgi:TusA-related sulfurtransferase